MSRSALWRQEANFKERERQAQGTFVMAVEEGRNNRSRGLIPLHGPDDSFNMNPMLLQNIAKSPYFIKCCNELTDWSALVDEIYYEVKHLEPWAAGAASKTPSSAFCLLLRLLTMRCSEKQMTLMLNHRDSPYIRCIGFLFLRYACEPREVWRWVSPHLYDQEEVMVSANPSQGASSVGEYLRTILTDLDYYGTRLPRLPVSIEREIKVKMLQAERLEERAKRHIDDSRAMEYFQKLGSRVQALYEDDENPSTWYDAVVDRVLTTDEESGKPLERPKFVVTFPEYGNTETVTLGEIDMPGGSAGAGNDSRKRGGEGRGRNDGHRGGRDHYEDESYDRRHRGRDRSRGRGWDDSSRRGRREERNRWERDRWSRGGRRNRSRSRERDANNQNLMEEVLRRDREKSTAKGKAYASRPLTTKESLSVRLDERKTQAGSEPPLRSDRGYGKDSRPKKDPPKDIPANDESAPTQRRERTAEELAAIAEKKRRLLAKYG